MDEHILDQLLDKYDNYRYKNETVLLICMDYDHQVLGAPRLIDEIVIENVKYYILACKKFDSVEIYGCFKYKGDATASKYGSMDIWTLNFP